MRSSTLGSRLLGHILALVAALGIALAIAFGAVCGGCAPSARSAPAGTSSADLDPRSKEPAFEAEMGGPITKATPLQIVSLFAYEPGERFASPAIEIANFVANARIEHGYGQEPLRTLALFPTPGSIRASRLLVIAWGQRSDLTLDRAKEVGRVAMREALAMGVKAMGYAALTSDQGVTTPEPDEVAAAFVEGALVEFLAEREATPRKRFALERVTIEAGPAQVDAVRVAVARGVDAAHAAHAPRAAGAAR